MGTVSTTLNAWLLYRQRLQHLGLVAASTLKNQHAVVLRLEDGLGSTELADLRKSQIEIYLGERLQTCKPVTVQGELNVLRQVLNWAVDEGMLNQKPRMPTIRVPNEEKPLPSDDAFLWVLANVPAHHAVALEFMMLTGLSPHELERVKQCDAGLTRVGDAIGTGINIGKRPDFQVKQESRRRVVPLNGRAEALWFEASAGVNGQGHPFPSVAAMQKAIQRTAGKPRSLSRAGTPLGSDQITPKLMRKWFASKVSNDQPEHVLQRLMGHAAGSPITRKHYVRSTDEQQLEAVGGLRFGRG